MSFMAFRDQVVRNGGEQRPEARGAGETRSRLGDERDHYLCRTRAQDGGGRGNTTMTLVGHPAPRNRNELVSLFIHICPVRDETGTVAVDK